VVNIKPNYTKQMPARKPQHTGGGVFVWVYYTKQMPARKPQLILPYYGLFRIIPNKCLPANHNTSFSCKNFPTLYQTNACPQTTTTMSSWLSDSYYTKQMPARKPQRCLQHRQI